MAGDAEDLMTAIQQLGDDARAGVTCGADDGDLHE
jgi:hypothetical protein